MSDAKKKLLMKPIIISNTKKMVIQSPKLLGKLKLANQIQQYKDEIIYSCANCDFLKGESQDVLIVNRLNLLTKKSRTIARCISGGNTLETSSDNVVSAIGQKNYETVLSALSSVFNEETKVRGILALLSVRKQSNSITTQTSMEITEVKKDLVTTESQTDDSRLTEFMKKPRPRRLRRQMLTPYVVTENTKVKKCVINLNTVKTEVTKKRAEEKFKERTTLPELKEVIDEDSNISSASDISSSSWPSLPGALDHSNDILQQIDKVTDNTLVSTKIRLRDGSDIMIPVKPEDQFHIATPEILKNVTHEERLKLIWHQAFIDFKLCLEQDQDGYYPIHVAVLNNDVDLVRRLSASLRARHESVDIIADGLTALQMAVRQNVSINCTNILLQNGADPLLCDQERRSSLHLAADRDSPQLRALLAYCDKHARSVLKNNQEFWRPEYESKTDEQLTKILYNRVSEMFDYQGYNPLMLAAESGIPSNVALLAKRAGRRVDATSPNCGATALYRAVARACLHAKETGNIHASPEKYLKTLEILVEHGADPGVENHFGSSVNTLLTEFNISVLSMTIANKMTALNHGKSAGDNLNMILYKHNDGRIGYKDINNVTYGQPEPRTVETGLHAVITVDVPSRLSPNSRKSEFGEDSKNRKVDEVKRFKDKLLKDIEADRNVLADNNGKIGGINTNTEVKNSETNNAIDNKNAKNPIKIGNIIWKPKTENSKDTDSAKAKIEGANAIKLNVKAMKDGNLGNITFKRLSSGQMVAITQTNLPEGAIPQIYDKKVSLINITPTVLNATKDTLAQLVKTSPNQSKDPPRSAKTRKTDNVIIVDDVPVKSLQLKVKPGPSKTAKASEILISPKPRILNEDIAARELDELTMIDVIPTNEKNDKTVKKTRKRKLR